jgi:hypothetical protein
MYDNLIWAPSGQVPGPGRPSLGTNEQQEQGMVPAIANPFASPAKAQGDNPNIEDSTSMFGNGPDTRYRG